MLRGRAGDIEVSGDSVVLRSGATEGENIYVTGIVHWAGIAVMHDPTSKAKYAALRKRGHGYYRSLRSVGDRLLFVACKLLEKGELFDKNFKKTTDVLLPDRKNLKP